MPCWRWTGREFTQRSFRNLYAGREFIVCCPGPSLKRAVANHPRLVFGDVPGAAVLAINTAYPTIRHPQAWVGMDGPDCYEADLPFTGFLKFWGTKYSEDSLAAGSLRETPGTHFLGGLKVEDGKYDHPMNTFAPSRNGEHPDFVWCCWTLFTALHVAAWMGARGIWLVGADFGGGADYHDGRKLEDHLSLRNAKAMQSQVEMLPILRQSAERFGIELASATEGSPANEHLTYRPLGELLDYIASSYPRDSGHQRLHTYVAEHSRWKAPKRLTAPFGVITGFDARTSWMIPWWYDHLRLHNPDVPVAFANFGGLDEATVAWCRERGEIVDCTDTGLKGWFNKPIALLRSPFKMTLWLDSDCQVCGSLAPAATWLNGDGRQMAGNIDRYATGSIDGRPRNLPADALGGGVLAVRHGSPLVVKWAREILSQPEKYRGDQEALAAVATGGDPAVLVIDPSFERFRLDGPPGSGETVYHYSGPKGKDQIRGMMRMAAEATGS